eukprot:gene10806-3424_t
MTSINTEIKNLITGNEEHLKILIEYVHHFKQVAVSIEEQNESNKTEEYKKDHKDVKELEEIAKGFIKMREETEHNVQALQSILNNPQPPNVLEQKYKQEFKKFSKIKFNEKYWNEHDLYNKFRKDVWDIHHKNEPRPWENIDDDDIIDATQPTQMDILCPIGRSVMKNPVKSKKCVHIFDKANIEQYLGKQTKNCPVAGCSAKLSMNLFSPDYEMEITIKEQLKNQASQRNDKPAISLDEEEEEEDEIIDL